MEIIIGLLAIAALVIIWYSNRSTGYDANKDVKPNIKDISPVVQNKVEPLKEVTPANEDEKINIPDAKEEVVKTVKKVAKPKDPEKVPAKPRTTARKPKMTVIK